MPYVLTTHALVQAGRRGISREILMQVVQHPEQRFPQRQGRHIFQSRVMFGDRPWLVRGEYPPVLEGRTVKARYDRHTDTLSIVFRPDDAIATSEELRPGLVIDLDDSGRVVSLEILDASRVIPEADRLEFQAIGA